MLPAFETSIPLLRTLSRRFLDILLPARCIGCGIPTEQPGTLCGSCWSSICFITKPYCHGCGIPFDFATSDEALCGQCLQQLPAYDHARAVFVYDDDSRHFITRFKYGDQIHTAPLYGNWLSQIIQPWREQIDVVLPVPLHRLRLLKRRYNQAALLAQHVARQNGLPYHPHALQRVKHIPPQASLTYKQRQSNVKGAFTVPDKYAPLIQGKSLLLIDDVMTTGATIQECAKVLKRHGAAHVYVAILGRTVKG